MKRGLRWALWWAGAGRWAPALAYVAVVIGLALLIQRRTPPPPPTTTRALAVNHRITAGDLETPAIRHAIGRYTKAAIAAGDPVTPELLGAGPPPPKLTAGWAALVSVPIAARAALAIQPGDAVQICAAGKTLGQSRVFSLECDAAQCLVLLALASPPPPADADALQHATLAKPPVLCAGP